MGLSKPEPAPEAAQVEAPDAKKKGKKKGKGGDKAAVSETPAAAEVPAATPDPVPEPVVVAEPEPVAKPAVKKDKKPPAALGANKFAMLMGGDEESEDED